ncbi:NADPH-dependent F420 reductase [Nocardia inohanensis]|uniref:NADPH-dependent F420 reductase n=1 Tax=Nocardia inohanensis TaxID=209246 RepID=UPI000836A9BC|nr:NAD(P)-binding domain-containing protein [Nocardia inohanensis]
MRVGFIGVGRIGGNLARLLTAGGHETLLSATNPEGPKQLAAELGATASAVSPQQAIAESDAVVIAVWWEAFAQVASEYGPPLQGRLVIDPSNPLTEVNGVPTPVPIPGGLTSPQHQLRILGDVRLVRTFGDRLAPQLLIDGERGQQGGARSEMRYWSDDAAAAALVVPLIHDAGFDPVDGGGLAQSKNAGEG